MSLLRFHSLAAIAWSGLVLSAEAQQPTLPANASSQIDPLISAPADGQGVLEVQGTLRTTTIQTQPLPFDPNQKVTADRYYELLGTTGSYRVNTDRAKALQEEALQRARRQKQIKAQMVSASQFQKTTEIRDGFDYLRENPPQPHVEAAPAGPAPESSVPTFSQPQPQVGNQGRPKRKTLFSSRRKQQSQLPEAPPAEYPEDLGEAVPTFDVPEPEPIASRPPPKKLLFENLGRKRSSRNSTPAPPTSIFRGASPILQQAESFFIVKGNNTYARVDGESIKILEGTRIRVLRQGTERSLVRLFDNRQATMANRDLVPEAE